MVSARKKRLNKESDFHKPKLKVGKRLPKNLNVTKIDLQTKKLIIKSQLKSNTGGAESTVDKKKRNIAELLIRVCHMNEKMRIDAVTSLDEILFPDESSINQLELMRHLSAIVRKLCVVLCDVSVQVRKLVCSLFSKICSAVSEKDFEGLFDLFMAHLCNALTHVDEAIQKSALILLYQVFENYGLLAVKQGRRVLPVLVHILAPLPVSTIAKRFKTTKHVSAGEYASACNVDDIAKQTEVMKRMHQYLSRMYEEQSECQIGFKNVNKEESNADTNLVGFRLNYFEQSSISLHSVLSVPTADFNEDDETNEISTSMITLTNVLFQILISVSQNLNESVSNPTNYDVCLQSLFYAVEVLRDVVRLHEKPVLGIKFTLESKLLASNFRRYVLQAFPYREMVRGQVMVFGKQLNNLVMEVCLLRTFEQNREYSDVLIDHMLESLLTYSVSTLPNISKVLSLAGGFVMNASLGKTNELVERILTFMEGEELTKEQYVSCAKFLFGLYERLQPNLKEKLVTILGNYTNDEHCEKLEIVLEMFLVLSRSSTETTDTSTLIGTFLFSMLEKLDLMRPETCQLFRQCVLFYGIVPNNEGKCLRVIADWFGILNSVAKEEMFRCLQIVTARCRNSQIWWLKLLMYVMFLKENGQFMDEKVESKFENTFDCMALVKEAWRKLEMSKTEVQMLFEDVKKLELAFGDYVEAISFHAYD